MARHSPNPDETYDSVSICLASIAWPSITYHLWFLRPRVSGTASTDLTQSKLKGFLVNPIIHVACCRNGVKRPNGNNLLRRGTSSI